MMNVNSSATTTIDDAGVMLAIMKGNTQAVPIDAEELANFCASLRGYTRDSYARVMTAPDATPMPAGFRNLRVFDARDGRLLGSRWHLGDAPTGDDARPQGTISDRRPTANTVVAICLGQALEEVVAWRSTSALPVVEPGVLDLEVDIDTRPREHLVTGHVLPLMLRVQIAALAPTRA